MENQQIFFKKEGDKRYKAHSPLNGWEDSIIPNNAFSLIDIDTNKLKEDCVTKIFDTEELCNKFNDVELITKEEIRKGLEPHAIDKVETDFLGRQVYKNVIIAEDLDMLVDLMFDVLSGKSEKKNKIKYMDESEYKGFIASGMFYELYPEATGNYVEDMELSKGNKFKIETN
jgi:translation elongation factor EF-G